MQRFHPLRWLALAMGFGLLGTQCQDSLSDDCTKTLTCDDGPMPTLGPDCKWRYPGGAVWEGGPSYDSATNRWRWPDGTESATQNLTCTVTDAGADSGLAGGDCRLGAVCDIPQVCDMTSGQCVQCTNDAECSGNLALGDAGAATACDLTAHICVPCVTNDHCGGDTPYCKTDPNDSRRNECVECTGSDQCGGDSPVCDLDVNECTATCTAEGECRGKEKPVCNVTKQLCVECLNNTQCTGGKQCNTTSNQCVECVEDAPCLATNEVCDLTSNNCVQCRENTQCSAVADANFCDTNSNLCVQCLNDTDCTAESSSRCNPVTHQCVGCTSDAQCEDGRLCSLPLGGRCVQCIDNNDCGAGTGQCDVANGRCVECLNTSQCLDDDSPRCETSPTAGMNRFTCQRCAENSDCAGKPGLGGLCRSNVNGMPGDGKCVFCLSDAECSLNPALSNCNNDGVCEICTVNDDCNGVNGRNACLTGTGCVECVVNTDCEGNADGGICKINNNGESSGSAALNTCVECTDDNDCNSPNAPRCVNNQCEACTADAHCGHLDTNGATAGGTLPVCDGSVCVECKGANRDACGTDVCNALTRTCATGRAAGLAQDCDECVSDEECASGSRCVDQVFDDQNVGFFCFPIAAGNPATCAGPRIFLGPVTRSTIDGAQPTPVVCQPRRTTCAALADYAEPASCDADADCGLSNVDDGVCDGTLDVCTVPCSGGSDCAGECDVVAGACEP